MVLYAYKAHASTLLVPACDTAADSFKCRLVGILNFLYAAAGILALVLIVVIVLAVRMYRKNRSAEKNPDHD
jgi:heme/copper-type cytochrome/quinol oxidase subunit 2